MRLPLRTISSQPFGRPSADTQSNIHVLLNASLPRQREPRKGVKSMKKVSRNARNLGKSTWRRRKFREEQRRGRADTQIISINFYMRSQMNAHTQTDLHSVYSTTARRGVPAIFQSGRGRYRRASAAKGVGRSAASKS